MTTSPRSDSWLFFGGTLSLDFVNTMRDRATTPRETLLSAAGLQAWVEQAELIPADNQGAGSSESVPDDLYVQALELREAIDAVLSPESTAQPSHAVVVNRWARLTPRPQLQEAAPRTVVSDPLTLAEALGAIAADAITVVTKGEQVKICAHQRCGLRFLDRSRARKRQWCSMQRCGNRTKVARHTARR